MSYNFTECKTNNNTWAKYLSKDLFKCELLKGPYFITVAIIAIIKIFPDIQNEAMVI